MENNIFKSEIGSGFGEPGGTLPPRIPGSNPAAGLMIPLKIQLFRERLSENVHATIPIVIVGGFEFTVFQFERMAREATDTCLRVLKESNKSKFDSYSVRNSVLIISHITFR